MLRPSQSLKISIVIGENDDDDDEVDDVFEAEMMKERQVLFPTNLFDVFVATGS